tara:strand:- start:58 stop:186 length:129 start_codon:yes stop_codon:yes gene_type:complete
MQFQIIVKFPAWDMALWLDMRCKKVEHIEVIKNTKIEYYAIF